MKMLSERDIRVLKVMIPNLSFIITKMVKLNGIRKFKVYSLFYVYVVVFLEISRASIEVINAFRRIFMCPI